MNNQSESKCISQILVRRSCWASRTGGLLVVDQLDSGSFYCELIKILEDNIYNEPIPDVEPQRTEQQGRDPADMEMEDPIESMGRVINEDGGSRTSQGQGGYRSNMVDTENLTGSRTMEVGVPEEQGTDVSDGVMEDLIDNFASGNMLSGNCQIIVRDPVGPAGQEVPGCRPA
ncbi:disease resistance protein [Salix suchowensis]|nr:disease resistance protein [Salix suchowensis]